jgi:hypothetical protein
VWEPALTWISSLARIPRLDSDVPVVSRAVPMAVAGVGAELEDVAEPDALEAADAEDAVEVPVDDVELPEGCSRLSTSEISWELTRFKAVLLAILDRPFDRFVIALPITLINESSADTVWFWAFAWLQYVWSCCQKEGVLPMLLVIGPVALNALPIDY